MAFDWMQLCIQLRGRSQGRIQWEMNKLEAAPPCFYLSGRCPHVSVGYSEGNTLPKVQGEPFNNFYIFKTFTVKFFTSSLRLQIYVFQKNIYCSKTWFPF